ncbi:MAG: hypothetical protein EHM53_10920 [Methanoregulaceae archaeon]|nr:MAG: hypothetical protein EHM53_10920 [Methanoregulaceae archaeon]
MRFSHIGIIAVMLVMIAVALAGCSGSSPTTPSTSSTQATPSSGITQVPGTTASSGSSGGSGAAASGAGLFGNLNYKWVEYKMSTGSGSDAMSIYMKFDRVTGKCTMRFEGAGASDLPPGMQEMDCGSSGQTSTDDPNTISTDAKVDCALLDELVTVPAGTFSATKCTVTSKGSTSTTWVAKGKFMVKMEGSSPQGGSTSMVLNAYE